jgi:hypothetical protein
LVLAVSEDNMLVASAYGTSQAHAQLRAWNLCIELQAGVMTVFDLSRVAAIPLDPQYFPRKPRLGAWPKARRAEIAVADAAIKANRRP